MKRSVSIKMIYIYKLYVLKIRYINQIYSLFTDPFVCFFMRGTFRGEYERV